MTIFFSLRGLPLPGRLSTVPCPATFQQLINTMLCPAFLRKFVCQPLCWVPLQIQTFYQNLVLAAEYHVDCWQTLQCRLLWRIFCARNWSLSKPVKRTVMDNFICNQYRESIAILINENIKIWARRTKLEAIKMLFVCVFFHICRKFDFFLISQGSVATCLRWGG